MNVALILVSLGIANAPEPLGHPLMVAHFEDMASCVDAANQAKLPVAGIPGRSLNTWAQFVCVPTKKPILPWLFSPVHEVCDEKSPSRLRQRPKWKSHSN